MEITGFSEDIQPPSPGRSCAIHPTPCLLIEELIDRRPMQDAGTPQLKANLLEIAARSLEAEQEHAEEPAGHAFELGKRHRTVPLERFESLDASLIRWMNAWRADRFAPRT